MQIQPIEMLPYNPKWPQIYADEAATIQKKLGKHLKAIHHIGSTAIPEMTSKAVIDMILEVSDLDHIETIATQLSQLGYDTLRRHVIPHWSFFTRKTNNHISFHLQIREVGDPQIRRHIHFRDYLKKHPEDAQQYTELKLNLANQFKNDRPKYVSGKDKLVQSIDAKAKLWGDRSKDFLPPNRGLIAKQWTVEKIIKAMEANFNVVMTHFAQYLNQIELIRIPGYTIVNAWLPNETFNYVLEADFTHEEVNRKIKDITDYFAKKHIPFIWWVSPYDKPDDLAKHLALLDYENVNNNAVMYFDLDASAKTFEVPELKIVRALDKKTLNDFAMVLAYDEKAFKDYFTWISDVITEEDPIEFYVGYINDEPVVRGAICYFAGVAGLHWLSTAPHVRHLGYGTAMQQFRLKRAKSLGYHIAVMQATREEFPLNIRLGYKECGVFREFRNKTNHSSNG